MLNESSPRGRAEETDIDFSHSPFQDEDYDEQEEERILSEKDEDEYVLSKMCEVMRAIFSTYKTDALPLFQQLMVHVVKLLVRSLILFSAGAWNIAQRFRSATLS